MTVKVANSSNTINATLVPTAGAAAYDYQGLPITTPTLDQNTGLAITSKSVPAASVYTAPYVAKASPTVVLGKKTFCYDTEETGTDPWDDRLLVVSFWDLSKPKNTMITFANLLDEEKLINEIATFLNTEKPEVLVQYNNGFDERHLLTRFMLYQVKVPGWNDIVQVDLMQILQRGTTQSISSSQAVGSDEQWYKYFFNEVKPYTIPECFEGVRSGDLTRFKLRNRTCVESEGSAYLLFRYATDLETPALQTPQFTQPNVEEQAAAGIYIVVCPTCHADNVVPKDSHNNKCWRCLGNIPDPTEDNRVKEQVRQFDFSKVGLAIKNSKLTETGVTLGTVTS